MYSESTSVDLESFQGDKIDAGTRLKQHVLHTLRALGFIVYINIIPNSK